MLRKPAKSTDAPDATDDEPSTPSPSGKLNSFSTEKHPKKAANAKSNLSSVMLPLSILLVVVLLSPFAYVLVTRLGLGAPFPSQPAFAAMDAILQPSLLEVVAELPMPPGNLAVSSNGRIFFNFHPEYGPSDVKIAELKTKTTFTAFPSAEFQVKIVSVLAMRIDRQDRLWLLDFGNHGIKGKPTLYAFALKKKDTLVKEYVFPPAVAGFGSMLNDFQVDPSGHFVYIVDTSIVSTTPSLIVYSVEQDYAYRILSSHSSMHGLSAFLDISGTLLKFGPMGLTINVDSVGLDRTGSKLYYGALTGDKLYSISTSHLLHYMRASNESSEDQAILDQVMPSHVRLVMSDKPATDGITVDGAGNIWMTALEHSSIAVAVPVKATQSLATGPSFALQAEEFKIYKVVTDTALLRWPDGFSFGPDGLYVSNSALHLKFSGQNYKDHAPYHILRLSTKSIKSAFSEIEGSSFSLPPAGH